MNVMIDDVYVAKLAEVLSHPLDFETFEGVLRSNMPELYKRSSVSGTLQCSHEHVINLLQALRVRLYGYLKEGHLLENNYINLWFLFSQTPLVQDATLSSFIALLEQSYATYDVTQKERFIFAHLLFVLKMANGEGVKCLSWFMGEHLWFDGKSYHLMDANAKALRSFCESFEIPVEWVIQGLADSLEVERFLKASYATRMGIGTWILGFFWQIKGFENHPCWRDILYPVLKQLFLTCKERGMIEEMMSLHFLMSHLVTNRIQTQEEMKAFNIEIEEEASAFYAKWAEEQKLSLPKTSLHVKKKIALVKDRIVENSPFKVEFSLLSALAEDKDFKEKYELVVYSMATIEKSLDDEKCIESIRNLGFDVRCVAFESLNLANNFQSHLTRALAIRNDMQMRGIDIMIVATNNMPISNFLFSTRSIAKQIFWSHGNFEYDVLGIDQRVSHFVRESSFEYSKFDIQILEKFHMPDDENHKALALQIRKRWSADTIILGSIGRLIKIDNEDYLCAIATLMKNNENTIYLACGLGHTQSILEKLNYFGISAERFYFEGHINPHIYGYVIDLYLNTFPEPSGESLNEFLKKKHISTVVNYDSNLPSVIEPTSLYHKSLSIERYILDANDAISSLLFYRNYAPKKREKHQSYFVSIGSIDVLSNAHWLKLIDALQKKFPSVKIDLWSNHSVASEHLAIKSLCQETIHTFIDGFIDHCYWQGGSFMHHLAKIQRVSVDQLSFASLVNNKALHDKTALYENLRLNMLDLGEYKQNGSFVSHTSLKHHTSKEPKKLNLGYIGHEDRLEALTIVRLQRFLKTINELEISLILNEDATLHFMKYFVEFYPRIHIFKGLNQENFLNARCDLLFNPLKYHNDYLLQECLRYHDSLILHFSFFEGCVEGTIEEYLNAMMGTPLNKEKFLAVYKRNINSDGYFKTMLFSLSKDYGVADSTCSALMSVALQNDLFLYLEVHVKLLTVDIAYRRALYEIEKRWHYVHSTLLESTGECIKSFIEIFKR